MREALIQTLTDVMAADPRTHLLTTDTGFHALDGLRETFSERYLNVGIGEAAMIGVAAGLALAGKQVFVYGIVPFVTMRCFEQIRVSLCQMRLPVRIVGVGGGLEYGAAGPTHHAIEDVALMSSLPNMTVLSPGDAEETRAAVRAAVSLRGPCYLRICKTASREVHGAPLERFEIGRAVRIRSGEGIAVLATGSMLAVALAVCEELVSRGLSPELISVPTLKPFDHALVVELATRCHTLATLEEHVQAGGLAAAVMTVVARQRLPVTVTPFCVPDAYAAGAGSREHLRSQYGLTAPQIAAAIVREESSR